MPRDELCQQASTDTVHLNVYQKPTELQIAAEVFQGVLVLSLSDRGNMSFNAVEIFPKLD